MCHTPLIGIIFFWCLNYSDYGTNPVMFLSATVQTHHFVRVAGFFDINNCFGHVIMAESAVG